MQSEQIRGCRDDPFEVQYQHHSKFAALSIKKLTYQRGNSLTPPTRGRHCPLPFTPLYVGF
jgi:hypothetical protein